MAHTAKPYGTVPTLFDRVQDELSAIEQITRVLGSLPDHDTRVRVITWINERFSNGFQVAQPLQQEPPLAVAFPASPAHAPSDSGLSFPDDLFEPAAGLAESGDLRDVFDQPAMKPSGLDLQGIFDPPAVKPPALDLQGIFDQPVEKPPALDLQGIFDQPVEKSPAVDPQGIFDQPVENVVDSASEKQQSVESEHLFVLVPPTEAPPSADLADAAIDEPAQLIDRRQLSLLLLADMSPASTLEVHAAPEPGDRVGEPAVSEPAEAPAPARAPTSRKARRSRPPAPQTSAPVPRSTIATEPVRPTPQRPVPPQSTAEPPQDSMEAMLRSLVDDFRQLADEWGNT